MSRNTSLAVAWQQRLSGGCADWPPNGTVCGHSGLRPLAGTSRPRGCSPKPAFSRSARLNPPTSVVGQAVGISATWPRRGRQCGASGPANTTQYLPRRYRVRKRSRWRRSHLTTAARLGERLVIFQFDRAKLRSGVSDPVPDCGAGRADCRGGTGSGTLRAAGRCRSAVGVPGKRAVCVVARSAATAVSSAPGVAGQASSWNADAADFAGERVPGLWGGRDCWSLGLRARDLCSVGVSAAVGEHPCRQELQSCQDREHDERAGGLEGGSCGGQTEESAESRHGADGG